MGFSWMGRGRLEVVEARFYFVSGIVYGEAPAFCRRVLICSDREVIDIARWVTPPPCLPILVVVRSRCDVGREGGHFDEASNVRDAFFRACCF